MSAGGPAEPSAGRTTPLRRFLGDIAVLVFASIATLLFAEIALRALGFPPSPTRPDRTLGYRWRPHASYRWKGEGASSGRTNADGWVDTEHPRRKPQGTTRILMCGDSYVEGLHVPLDSTFHRRLERTLNARPGGRYEVIAMGVSGSGTTQEYLTYRNFGAPKQPDVVAVLFILNDWADNSKSASVGTLRPFFVESGDTLALDSSFVNLADFRRGVKWAPLKHWSSLFTLFARVRQELKVRLHPTAEQAGLVGNEGWYATWNFHTPPAADTLAAFRLTERILARFADDVRRDGRRFVLIAAGAAEQEDRGQLAKERQDPTFDPDKTQRFLEAVGVRHGFEVVPLTPAFRAASAAGGTTLWFTVSGHFGHWNAAGHALAAEVLADYFSTHP